MNKHFLTIAALAACGLAFSLAASFAGCGDDSSTDAGTTASCDTGKYQSSCLTDIPNDCFKAEGKCTLKDKTEADWANGAKVTNVITGTDVDSTWWSATNEKCFTTHVSLASAQSAYDYSLTTMDGKTYKFHTVMQGNTAQSTDVTCPDGTTEKYTQADFDAVKACYQSGASSEGCKCADGTLGCISSSATICNTDTDCIGKPEGEKCCGTTGTKLCAATCSTN